MTLLGNGMTLCYAFANLDRDSVLRNKFVKFAAIILGVVIQSTSLANANTIEELDRLAEATVDEQQGIKLAQEQASKGEFLEAIGSLERVLALHPKSNSARLLHAVYLCQIDDQFGGAIEIGKLKKKNFPDDLWADVLKLCPLAGKE